MYDGIAEVARKDLATMPAVDDAAASNRLPEVVRGMTGERGFASARRGSMRSRMRSIWPGRML
jgi:hypothetical protein